MTSGQQIYCGGQRPRSNSFTALNAPYRAGTILAAYAVGGSPQNLPFVRNQGAEIKDIYPRRAATVRQAQPFYIISGPRLADWRLHAKRSHGGASAGGQPSATHRRAQISTRDDSLGAQWRCSPGTSWRPCVPTIYATGRSSRAALAYSYSQFVRLRGADSKRVQKPWRRYGLVRPRIT